MCWIFINGKLYRSGSSAEVMARAIDLAGERTVDGTATVAQQRQSLRALAGGPLPPGLVALRGGRAVRDRRVRRATRKS